MCAWTGPISFLMYNFRLDQPCTICFRMCFIASGNAIKLAFPHPISLVSPPKTPFKTLSSRPFTTLSLIAISYLSRPCIVRNRYCSDGLLFLDT